MTSEAATTAHILRRLTFGPFPGGVEAAQERYDSHAAHIDALIAAKPIPFKPPISIDRPFNKADEGKLGNSIVVKRWMKRMLSDDAAVHERMMWFWHNTFTSSAEKGTFLFLWQQLRKFHTHAMGNYRELAKEMVIDATIIQFLDGDGSSFHSPNENLARELMELFMLGRGNYTEADVRAAARALSGRSVNFKTGNADLNPLTGPRGIDTFLGKTAEFNDAVVIDTILEQPAASTYVVRRLWKYFIGTTPDEALVQQWADEFRAGDWEIEPLVANVVRSKAFLDAVHSRPRTGIEWLTAALRAGNPSGFREEQIHDLGQVPYYPPNVAGWPDQSMWQSSAIQFARASYLSGMKMRLKPPPDGADPVQAALHHCGLFDATTQTTDTMAGLAQSLDGDQAARTAALVHAAMLSPEFSVA